jgi:hypothetical protein
VLARVESRFSTLVVHQIADRRTRWVEFHRRNDATLTTGFQPAGLGLDCALSPDAAQGELVLRKGSVRT